MSLLFIFKNSRVCILVYNLHDSETLKNIYTHCRLLVSQKIFSCRQVLIKGTHTEVQRVNMECRPSQAPRSCEVLAIVTDKQKQVVSWKHGEVDDKAGGGVKTITHGWIKQPGEPTLPPCEITLNTGCTYLEPIARFSGNIGKHWSK